MGTGDLWNAIATLWTNASLDTPFKALWGAEHDQDDYPVLNDMEATPGHPQPYCVCDVPGGRTINRMSNTDDTNREIRDIPVRFHVHAKKTSLSSNSAKQIARDLAEEIMKKFGGHPTVAPTALELTNANWMQAQYQTDYGIRTGDDEYEWVVSYLMKIDVVNAVT